MEVNLVNLGSRGHLGLKCGHFEEKCGQILFFVAIRRVCVAKSSSTVAIRQFEAVGHFWSKHSIHLDIFHIKKLEMCGLEFLYAFQYEKRVLVCFKYKL